MGTILISAELVDLVKNVLQSAQGADMAVRRGEILRVTRLRPRLLDTSDRQVRAAIEELRQGGMLICNLLTGDGYYLATTMHEYQEFRRKYCAYATSIFERLRAMDAAAEQVWGASALQERLL